MNYWFTLLQVGSWNTFLIFRWGYEKGAQRWCRVSLRFWSTYGLHLQTIEVSLFHRIRHSPTRWIWPLPGAWADAALGWSCETTPATLQLGIATRVSNHPMCPWTKSVGALMLTLSMAWETVAKYTCDRLSQISVSSLWKLMFLRNLI